MADEECIFCRIAAGELPAQIVDEDERTVTFMDIAPATRGHLLVVPRQHSTDVLDAAPEDLTAVALAAQRAAERVMDRLGAAGVNILNSTRPAAWQTVFHLHFHVIPRYEGDPLQLPWVPETGDPEEIGLTAEALK